MPIYEFHCRSCQLTFEKISKLTDAQQPCPTCGQPSEKAVSIPSRGSLGPDAAVPSCGSSCGRSSGFS